VSPLDPLTFGLVAGGLGLAAGLAVFVPTRRASALDPAATLRAD
jgi:ABC-type lipoprotein release transport system permease subunit